MSSPSDAPGPPVYPGSPASVPPSARPGQGVPEGGPQAPTAPPVSPQAARPPAGPPLSDVPPAYASTQVAQSVPASHERKPGRWIWWTVGILVVLFACAGLSALAAVGGSGMRGFSAGTGDTVAVIPFEGTIAGTGVAPSTITPEDFLKLLERAENDPRVRAIVLRVNSPGGTVAASEEISTYVKNSKKPVVISVGDVDASGAYMVSSQADRIVANPGSAVGSIGVIMEVPNASGLLDKLGLQFKVLTAGKYKDAGSPFRSLTPTETAMLQGQIDQVYGQFIDIVASGRRLPRSEVESLATGWAWNAVEAKQLHLVDQIGTYKDATAAAARLGGIQGEYKTDVYSNTQPFSGLLSALLGIESQLQSISANNPTDPASSRGSALTK